MLPKGKKYLKRGIFKKKWNIKITNKYNILDIFQLANVLTLTDLFYALLFFSTNVRYQKINILTKKIQK
jgi:hypothetical protein